MLTLTQYYIAKERDCYIININTANINGHFFYIHCNMTVLKYFFVNKFKYKINKYNKRISGGRQQ